MSSRTSSCSRSISPRPAIESISPAVIPERLEDSAAPLSLDVHGFGFRRGAVVLVDDKRVATFSCEANRSCFAEHLVATIDGSLLRASGFKRISVLNPDPSIAPSEIAMLRVESLQPTITTVSPGSATVLGLPPTVIEEDDNILKIWYTLPVVIFGTNFDPKAEVRAVRVTPPPVDVPDFAAAQVISSTQLVYQFKVTYPDSIGQWQVQVKNPQPGGGVSEPAYFLITEGSFVANPFLISVVPDAVSAGGPGFTLTVNGTNFQSGSQINWFSTPLATTFVSANQLRAEVPAALVKTPGKRPVTVNNPDNGGTSNALFVRVD